MKHSYRIVALLKLFSRHETYHL